VKNNPKCVEEQVGFRFGRSLLANIGAALEWHIHCHPGDKKAKESLVTFQRQCPHDAGRITIDAETKPTIYRCSICMRPMIDPEFAGCSIELPMQDVAWYTEHVFTK
jgi:hypothetical protein